MVSVISHYLAWHYGAALSDIAHLWKLFLRAPTQFFSVRLLMRTFFKPFRRIKMKAEGGANIEDYASTFATNLLMRIVGMLLRAALIVAGILVQIFVLLIGVVMYVLWLAAPLVLLYAMFYSILLFFVRS